jgi:hypothetical protein
MLLRVAGGVLRHPQQLLLVAQHIDVLAAPPKSAHPGALAVLKESYRADDVDTARVAITALEIDYGAK